MRLTISNGFDPRMATSAYNQHAGARPGPKPALWGALCDEPYDLSLRPFFCSFFAVHPR